MPLMFIDDTESNTSGTTATTPYAANAETTHKTGLIIAGVAGYGFDYGLRVEGEWFFVRSKLDKMTYSGTTATGTSLGIGEAEAPIFGTAKQPALSANVGKDVETESEPVPFCGGGIGFMRVEWGDVKYNKDQPAQTVYDALRAANPRFLNVGISVPDLSTTDTVLVWQLGVGLGYSLDDNVTL